MRQLRVCVTAPDYDEALRFYRDVLGLPVREAYGERGRVTILDAGRATLELLDEEHAAFVDEVEVGRRVAGHVRLAFEVDDAADADAGARGRGRRGRRAADADAVGVAERAPRGPGRPPAHALPGRGVVDADPVEIRLLGCLIEKQRTTPDAYPLSLNSLRLAANQSTNRDPVMDLDETTVRDAVRRLGDRRWARLASGAGSRAIKYRHLLDDALSLTPSQLAVLAVLMLRGPQTPGELKSRTERLYPFPSLEDVQRTLQDLADRELVERLERRPGQKEERYRQLLGGAGAEEEQVAQSHKSSLPDEDLVSMQELEARLARVEAKLDELMRSLDAAP